MKKEIADIHVKAIKDNKGRYTIHLDFSGNAEGTELRMIVAGALGAAAGINARNGANGSEKVEAILADRTIEELNAIFADSSVLIKTKRKKRNFVQALMNKLIRH